MSEPFIAVTIGTSTRQLTDEVRQSLFSRGWPSRAFVAEGAGRAMERAVLDGHVSAVLDLTLTELAAELVGVRGGAGPDRLTAAGLRGIPQVIAPGGLEFVDGRAITSEEFDRLGQEIAIKASAAHGPTTIVIPTRCLSPILIQSSKNWLSPRVGIRELNLHINDPEFAAAIISALEAMRSL